METKTYKHLIVKPETHKLYIEAAEKEGRDVMFLADMLIKNYVINLRELGNK